MASKSLCESFLNYPVPVKREQELHESFLNFDTEELSGVDRRCIVSFMNNTHLNKA